MIVFKNYFKFVKKYFSIIIIYTVIFGTFAVAFSSSANSGAGNTFSSTKPNIAIVNNDENGKLSNTFMSYVKENAIMIDVGKTDQELRDALFYREVDYILIIPANFSEAFMNKENPQIETMKVPDSYGGIYSEMLFNRFLDVANAYINAGMNEEQLCSVILDDFKNQSDVKLLEEKQSKLDNVRYFYNFTNYTLLGINILVIGMIMSSFKDPNIRKRNIISPISYKKLNVQLFLGNLCITLFLWLLYFGISIAIYGNTMFTNNGLLIVLNSLAFSITVLSIAFLVGSFIRSKEAQSGIVNVVALGSSFICGAFVPQEMLGNFVLNMAKFLPSYWYIKNNNDIALLSNFNTNSLMPIILNMGIILLFGLGIFIITNIISRIRLKKS